MDLLPLIALAIASLSPSSFSQSLFPQTESEAHLTAQFPSLPEEEEAEDAFGGGRRYRVPRQPTSNPAQSPAPSEPKPASSPQPPASPPLPSLPEEEEMPPIVEDSSSSR